MSDELKKRGKANEDKYFHDQELKALEGLATKMSVRKSPITGDPMKTVMYQDVEIDVCEESGGIWLDKGELEKIIENVKSADKAESWFEKVKENIGF